MDRPVSIFIMAGGSGERFWPMSRASLPKHLLKLVSDDTLLGEAVTRASHLVPPDRLFVLTNEGQLDAVRAAVPTVPGCQVVAEPAKRDTAPAAALATAIAWSRDPRSVVVLVPADTLTRDTPAFVRNVADAIGCASERGSMVTLGVPPRYPATGFGYLERGESLGTGQRGTALYRVGRFREKPDEKTAAAYVESGQFYWNAGMFVWRAESFLAEAEKQTPLLADFIRRFPAGDFGAYLRDEFPKLPKISVDYAIMEKAGDVVVAAAEFDWDDVGSWTALPGVLGADAADNTVRGDAAILESEGNILVSTGRALAVCGVRDLIVVETPDAVLVCHKDRAQDIKKLVPLLPPDVR